MALKDHAPVAPAQSVISVLETFRETGFGGAAIDVGLLGRLSLGEEIARRVVASLRLLELIDDEGRPTSNLVAFKQANSETYKQVLADQLFDVYSPVFAVVGKDFSGKTPTQIEDAFRTFKPDSLRKRMVTLFLGLSEYTGIVPERPKGKPGPREGTVRKPVKPRQPKGLMPTPPAGGTHEIGGTHGIFDGFKPKPPPPSREGEEVVVRLGDAGTVTLIVNVRWLDLPDDKLLGLRKVTAELRALGDAPADQGLGPAAVSNPADLRMVGDGA